MSKRSILSIVGDSVTWVLGVSGLGLGVLGLIKAVELPAKIISLATGLFFVAVPIILLLWRRAAKKADYVIGRIQVRQGKLNRPGKGMVEMWVREVVSFWSEHYPASEVRKALKGVLLVFVDQEKLSVAGRWVRGYSWGGIAVAGFRKTASGEPDWVYTRNLTIHELSHHVLGPQVGWDEKKHHDLFKEKGLDH